ncbi:RNA 2',3'-cyclic phosphodiesterase [Kaustia mangrovi]|uniref:RNA 2',3'-cyclic phosphodiesterase n=1 Tax=Kaustia mangrovi TaxID=2593653 RepID=A0A7S8C2R1_9HYPH|nr:RNA 2',3'-cyclic phosphodiesterase [Kaustia mangrovi]QPC42306.1 RNA 2',3'-cyclic phosphodiesterase [Kaustia mangrovi]
MPRLFTGIEIPADIAFELELMRGGVWGARWIDRESYHITLRFIGDVSEGTAREVAETLDMIDMPAFTLKLKGVDTFGGAKPRTIFAGVAEHPELRRLQSSQERLFQMIGLKPETRKFTPHVTLARLRDPVVASVESYVMSHSLFESRPFDVSRFVLFSSRPSRGGGPYAVEEIYPLESDYRLNEAM